MNPVIWCIVGALVGWLGGAMMPAPGRVRRIEDVLVGVFGAFIGGEFLAAMLAGGGTASGFRISSLAFAVGGAVAMLLLLALMRRSVGPLRPHGALRSKRPR